MNKIKLTVLAAVLMGTTGCTHMNHFTRKLDMVAERMSTAKHTYEGSLKSARQIGPLVALQFYDGQSFDVTDCPSSLVPGDIVRIYQKDDRYFAHLWRAHDSQSKS